MPEHTDADKGLSEQQLDDLDVNRQRERLERSRPGKPQPDEQSGQQAPGDGKQQQDRR